MKISFKTSARVENLHYPSKLEKEMIAKEYSINYFVMNFLDVHLIS